MNGIFAHIVGEHTSTSAFWDGQKYTVDCIVHRRKKWGHTAASSRLKNKRRQYKRLQKRITLLKKYFQESGIAPADGDRLLLREIGYTQPLTASQFAAVCINIAKRRGIPESYTGRDHRDTRRYKLALRNDVVLVANDLVPATFLRKCRDGEPIKLAIRKDKPVTILTRATIEKEFDAIAAKQLELGLSLDYTKLRHIIFFQRQPYQKRSNIPNCRYKPKRKVAYAARREYQRYRVKEELGRMALMDDLNDSRLPKQVYKKLYKLAMDGVKLTSRRLDRLIPNSYTIWHREKLNDPIFSTSDRLMSLADRRWRRLPDDTRDKIIDLLLRAQEQNWDPFKKECALIRTFELDVKMAGKLADVILPTDRCAYSIAALQAMENGQQLNDNLANKRLKNEFAGFKYAQTHTKDHMLLRTIYTLLRNFRKYAHQTTAVLLSMRRHSDQARPFTRFNSWSGCRITSLSDYIKYNLLWIQNSCGYYSNEHIREEKLHEFAYNHIVPEHILCDDSFSNMAMDVPDMPLQWYDPTVGTQQQSYLFRNRDRKPTYIDKIVKDYHDHGTLPSFCYLSDEQLSPNDRVIMGAIRVEAAALGLDIRIHAVTKDIIKRLRRRFCLSQYENSHLQQAMAACLLISAKTNDCAAIIQHATANLQTIIQTANNTQFKQHVQRAGRAYSNDDAIYIVHATEEPAHYKEDQSLIEKFVALTRSEYEIVEPLCEEPEDREPTHTLIATLRKYDTIQVNHGNETVYYYLSELRGMRFKRSAYTNLTPSRKSEFDIRQKGLIMTEPSSAEAKMGIRLCVKHKVHKVNNTNHQQKPTQYLYNVRAVPVSR